MTVEINGLIAAEHLRTTDGRVISDIDWYPERSDQRVPVYYVPLPHGYAGHVEGSDEIGWFEVQTLVNGLVLGDGEVEWPEPKERALKCGVDLRDAHFVDLNKDGQNMGESGTLRIVGGEFTALTVYGSKSDLSGAWPFTHVWTVD